VHRVNRYQKSTYARMGFPGAGTVTTASPGSMNRALYSPRSIGPVGYGRTADKVITDVEAATSGGGVVKTYSTAVSLIQVFQTCVSTQVDAEMASWRLNGVAAGATVENVSVPFAT